jgi:hypothetical protein
MLNMSNFVAMLNPRRFATLLVALLWNWAAATAQHTVLPSWNHDFGIVMQGQRLTHKFAIPNAGTSPLRIDRIDLSVQGITTRFLADIPPGGEGRVVLEWDTSQANGEAEATATVRLNDPDRPEIPLQIKAVVKPPIEFVPYPAVFFAAYQDEAPEKRLKIIDNEGTPLLIERIEYPEDHYEVALETIEPGKIYELRVKVRAGVPLGRYTEPIYLQTDRAQKPRLKVLANLFVKPNLYAFPEAVDFGSLSLEALDRQPELLETLTQTTLVTNRFGPLEIRSVDSDVPFLEVSRTPAKDPSQQFRFDVALSRQRMQKGRIFGKLRIITSDPNVPEFIIPLRGEVK